MMFPMMCRPPKRSALAGARSGDGKAELGYATGSEGTVGKISVIKPGDGEHAKEVECCGHGNGCEAPADPDHAKTHEVHSHERNDSDPVDSSLCRVIRRLGCAGVDPHPDARCGPHEGASVRLDQCWGLFRVVWQKNGPLGSRVQTSGAGLRGSVVDPGPQEDRL